MDELQLTYIGKDCLNKARSCANELQIFESLRHFLLSLEFLPRDRESLQVEFATILGIANNVLNKDDDKQIEDMRKCYKLALEYFPANAAILTNFGTFLLMLQASGASIPYFVKALQSNPHYLLADKNLESAKLDLLSRWHFRMLNDTVRNTAYRNAIHAAITPHNNKILDIGSGCGLLSYYALESNDVQKIIAVESSEELYKISKQALGNFDKLNIINTHSTNLNGIELSNLLITEIFDAGFFGEWFLGTIIHAWDNLLEPSAKIVPSGSEIFVTGISSTALLNKHKLCNDIPGLNLKNMCVTQNNEEPYEAEYLKYYNVQYITDTKTAVRISFNDVDLLKSIYTSYDAIEPITLKCVTAGTLHAFAIWFDLHLDNNITITTDPNKQSVTCWEQAIIYLDHPLELEVGQEINVQFSCVGNKVDIKILNNIMICKQCFKVSQSIIKFLNDAQNINAARELELPSKFNNCDILELNPFPLFMLYRARRGILGRYWFQSENEDDLKCIEYIWKSNTTCGIEFNTASSYDVIFINPISENGTINENTFQNYEKYCQWLNEGGLILPKTVKLQLELIDSAYLDVCSKVDDKNLLGLQIAKNINEYMINEHWQVEPEYFPRKILAQAATNYDLIPSCFKDHLCNFTIDIVEDGTINGVLYCFKLEYADDVSINTYNATNYFAACFICTCRQAVTAGDKVQVNVIYSPGFLKIDLQNTIVNDTVV